jgi:hypothetical protein
VELLDGHGDLNHTCVYVCVVAGKLRLFLSRFARSLALSLARSFSCSHQVLWRVLHVLVVRSHLYVWIVLLLFLLLCYLLPYCYFFFCMFNS